VDVVTHLIEVERPVVVTEQVEVEINPSGASWAPALAALADQIDTGRLYDRHLKDLAESLELVLTALNRRPARQRLTRRP
jgi:hypothetical protein